VEGDSIVLVPEPEKIKGKKVLVIEDGPTLTHGEMTYGAGAVAARENGAAELVDPRPYAVGTIKATFEKYSHLTDILPAMGYGDEQRRELEETIKATPCDLVLVATPIDLAGIIKIDKPSMRVTYELEERSKPDLEDILADFLKQAKVAVPAGV
jgi:predicted GTPase